MNYYIADTHFGHLNGMIYDSNNGGRQFSSIEERDAILIQNINKVVTPQDNLYFLGDVSWHKPKETEELLSQINCKNLFLVRGNHDKWIKDSKCKKYFAGTYDIKEINDNGRKVFMCHYPVMMWKGQHKGAYHLYGHVHNTREYVDYQNYLSMQDGKLRNRDKEDYRPIKAYNVGCMMRYMDYTPRTLDELILLHG